MDLLTEYLSDVCTPERKAVLLEACDNLETIGISDHYDYIDQLLTMAQIGNTDATLGAITNTLYNKYVEAVNSYGIQLVDDVDLRVMSHLIWGLNIIEQWADPQMIYDAIESSSTPIDALSDVLGLITEEGTEEWFTHFVSVAPALITRIKETIAPQLVVDTLDDEDALMAVTKVERFNRYFTSVKPPLLAKALVQLDWRVGMDVSHIPPTYLDQLLNLDDATVGMEVAGFVALSNCEDSAMETTAIQLIDLIYDDITRQERVLNAYNRIIRGQ